MPRIAGRTRPPIACAAAAALIAGLAPATAADTPTFPPATVLSQGGAQSAAVAVDAAGRAWIVWERYEASRSRIEIQRFAADGTPSGGVQTLSDGVQDAIEPRIAVDSQGRATVVWRRQFPTETCSAAPGCWRIQVVRLSAAGVAGVVQTISPENVRAVTPLVAIDSQDRAWVVWSGGGGTNSAVLARRLGADGAPDGDPLTLTAEGERAKAGSVVIDALDRAWVAWWNAGGGNTTRDIRARRIGADKSLGPIKVVGISTSAGSDGVPAQIPGQTVPDVAVDSQGRATVVWSRSGTEGVEARRIEADGDTMGDVRSLESGTAGSQARVVADSQDRVTVVWRTSDGIVKWRRLGADGALHGSPEQLGTSGTQYATAGNGLDLVVGSDDVVLVGWLEDEVGIWLWPRGRMTVRSIEDDGTLGSKETLSGRGAFSAATFHGAPNYVPPGLAVDSEDRLWAAWHRAQSLDPEATDFRIEAVRSGASGGGTRRQPDAMISLQKSSGYVTDGLYNTTGRKQTKAAGASRGGSVVFFIRGQNDGDAVDSFAVLGCKGGRGFTVAYLAGAKGATVITRGVVRGTYRLANVGVGAFKVLRVKVTVGRNAGIGSILTCAVKLTSGGDATKRDVVKAKVTAKR